MLVVAAVLPHPPLLGPEVASGASPELEVVRGACLTALKRVAAAHADGCNVVVVGPGPERATFPSGCLGTFRGFGVPVDVRLPGTAVESDAEALPLSLTVAAWQIAQIGEWDVGPPVRAESVPQSLGVEDAAVLGRALADSADRVALVVMGDGSSALSVKAPGYVVPGAQEWQNGVTQAIASADSAGLVAITPDDAERFCAAGRPAWQVLAGAAEGAAWSAELLIADDQYGVAYVVASWERTDVDT